MVRKDKSEGDSPLSTPGISATTVDGQPPVFTTAAAFCGNPATPAESSGGGGTSALPLNLPFGATAAAPFSTIEALAALTQQFAAHAAANEQVFGKLATTADDDESR